MDLTFEADCEPERRGNHDPQREIELQKVDHWAEAYSRREPRGAVGRSTSEVT